MITGFPLDFVALVPGKDERETIDGLLSKRGKSLGVSEINFKILVHPRRDPGCYHEAQDILQPFVNQAAHALVIFDHEGSGQEDRDASNLAVNLRSRLSKGGWADRAEVIVVEPELEVWVWSESPEVERTLGWSEQSTNLRTFLARRGLWPTDKAKPPRPKEAVEKVLREVRVRRSSSIYRQLSQSVSLERCEDRSFLELKRILRSWFPLEAP